jgi:RimJ/RimL family protein N-acetyltransferase
MNFIPVQDFTDTHWAQAYEIVYDVDSNQIMGTDPSIYATPPSLVGFYESVISRIESGTFQGWLFTGTTDDPIGYVVLDKSKGEWEIGISIKDSDERNKGYGPKAALKALKWAFEERNVQWVTAFTMGTDIRVPQMVKKMGFHKLYHFWVMPQSVWTDRWAGKVK